MSDLATFDRHLREWAFTAHDEWGYDQPNVDWFERVHRRLPVGLRSTIARGLDDGLIDTVQGHRFTLAGLAPRKGPYAWFSRWDEQGAAAPNWAYFVQAAEYLRVSATTRTDDLTVDVEDHHVDVTVSDGDELLWYIEVEERFGDAAVLADRVQEIGTAGIDPDTADVGDDAPRMATLLLGRRPLYVSFAGIGGRIDCSVAYTDTHHFDLVADVVPYA